MCTCTCAVIFPADRELMGIVRRWRKAPDHLGKVASECTAFTPCKTKGQYIPTQPTGLPSPDARRTQTRPNHAAAQAAPKGATHTSPHGPEGEPSTDRRFRRTKQAGHIRTDQRRTRGLREPSPTRGVSTGTSSKRTRRDKPSGRTRAPRMIGTFGFGRSLNTIDTRCANAQESVLGVTLDTEPQGRLSHSDIN